MHAAGEDQEIRYLSGGNQQKVILARWLAMTPRVLLFDEPTRGIDVGAKAAIHDLIRRLADDGAAVLMISSELPELLGMSDRIVVMRDGAIAGELPGGACEEDVVGLATGTSRHAAMTVAAGRTACAPIDSTRGVWVALAITLTVGGVLVYADGGSLFHQSSIVSMLQRAAGLGIVAIGQTFAILAGSLDLSVAYVISLTSLIAAADHGRIRRQRRCVAIGLRARRCRRCIGLVNGLLITKLRINAFIATLGVGLLIKGYLEQGYAGPAGSVPASLQRLGYDRIGPVPLSFLLMVGGGGRWRGWSCSAPASATTSSRSAATSTWHGCPGCAPIGC